MTNKLNSWSLRTLCFLLLCFTMITISGQLVTYKIYLVSSNKTSICKFMRTSEELSWVCVSSRTNEWLWLWRKSRKSLMIRNKGKSSCKEWPASYWILWKVMFKWISKWALKGLRSSIRRNSCKFISEGSKMNLLWRQLSWLRLILWFRGRMLMESRNLLEWLRNTLNRSRKEGERKKGKVSLCSLLCWVGSINSCKRKVWGVLSTWLLKGRSVKCNSKCFKEF